MLSKLKLRFHNYPDHELNLFHTSNYLTLLSTIQIITRQDGPSARVSLLLLYPKLYH
jgi:hypothetical protein